MLEVNKEHTVCYGCAESIICQKDKRNGLYSC